MADAIARPAAAPVASLGSFAPPGWQDAINNATNNGREQDLDQGPMRGFKTVTGDPDGVHHMSSISVWGQFDKTGQFVAQSISLDDQEWQLGTDGKYHVDEWIHGLSPNASSWNPLHYFELVSRDGNVENSGSLPQSAGDPRANLAKLIAGWAKYQPAPTPAIAAPTALAPPRAVGVSRR